MDFSNRNVQQQTAAPGASTTAAASPSPSVKKPVKDTDGGKFSRIATVIMIAAVVILLGAVVALASFGGSKVKAESEYVESSKLQAVFLNTGQVYFGNVKSLNSRYFVLTNIYYLQTSNANASGANANTNASVSLVKLGCELHEPLDQMVINRDQVTFWENLGDNGQVAKAVATFEKQNPSGQKCADQSTSSSNNSGSSVQSAGSSNSSSTGTNKNP